MTGGAATDPFRELVAVMDRLRSPGGCPWDAAQTHESLVPFLLEEAHELAVHRHPHVFAGAQSPAERLHVQWDAIKKAEKGRQSALDGIPGSLPALARAQKVAARAARAGLDVESACGPRPAPGSPAAAAPCPPADAVIGQDVAAGAALGEQLLTLAQRAQAAGLDAEGELRRATARLEGALREAERGDRS